MSLRRVALEEPVWCYSFGNGAARGVAAMVVCILLQEMIEASETPATVASELLYILESLVAIRANYVRHGDGSDRAAIVANIARQEQDAKVQGVSTIEWIRIILQDRRMSLDEAVSVDTRASVLEAMNTLTEQYEKLPEVEAYNGDVPPPLKKARGRQSVKAQVLQEAAEEEQRAANGIHIGTRKLRAIKMFLQHATQGQLERIYDHLHTVSYKYSALSDDVLCCPLLYADLRVAEGISVAGVDIPVPVGVEACPMHLKPQLTKEQAELLIDKICSTFEADVACFTSEEAKVKCRAKLEDISKMRDGVRWWLPAGKTIATKELGEDARKDMEQTVLYTSLLDSEISSLVQRGPSIFHKGMLPSFTTALQLVEGPDASELTAAAIESAKARFKLFKAGWDKDVELLQQHAGVCAGVTSLLVWKELSHKREQAKIGATLVADHMQRHWRYVLEGRQDRLGQRIAEEVAKSGPTKLLVLLDLNVPHTRDLTKLKGLANSLAAALQATSDSMAVVWCPDFTKQSSEDANDEEEAKIMKELRSAGLNCSRRVMAMQRPAPGSENLTNVFPWWTTARLVVLGSADPDTITWLRSTVGRTLRFPKEMVLPKLEDLLEVTAPGYDQQSSMAKRRDQYFRAAQKGPSFAEEVYRSLFDPPTTFQSDRTTLVVDISPHSGDRAVGLRRYIKSLGHEHSMGSFKFLAITAGGPGSAQAASVLFSEARLAEHLAREWFEKALLLTDPATGQTREVQLTVPEPTAEEFAMIPGGAAAYAGATSLGFEVCRLSGSVVAIKEEWIAEFANAHHEIHAAFDAVKREHDEKFAQAICSATSSSVVPTNPRDTSTPLAKTWDNLAALEQEVQVVHKARNSELQIDVLLDSTNKVYFLDAAGDRTLLPGSYVGGFGSGTLVPTDLQLNAVVPFELPHGDKTLVQLSKLPGEPEEAPKFMSGTLFQILRHLEGKGYFDISVAKLGRATPDPKSPCYTFLDPQTTGLDFVLKGATHTDKTTKENIFRVGVPLAYFLHVPSD